MVWNSVWPIGTVSVRANRTTGAQNTAYIEDTMGNTVAGAFPQSAGTRDHFWKVSSDFDGRHRFIQSPKFESPAGTATDPVLGTQMDGVTYLRKVSVTDTTIQGFYQNAQGIYQHIPTFLQGTVAITSSSTTTYTNIITVPANVYGQIAMYQVNGLGVAVLGKYSGVTAHFRSDATTVEAWGITQSDQDTSSNVPLKFGNGSKANGLMLMARRSDAGSATWLYRITYRAI